MLLNLVNGIHLDTFPPLAAQTVIELFALLGLSRLVLQHVCGKLIISYNSLPSAGTLTANIVNTLLLTLMVLGLILSRLNFKHAATVLLDPMPLAVSSEKQITTGLS